MSRSRHHDEIFLSCEQLVCLAIQIKHDIIVAANDQEGWSLHARQHVRGQIWPSTARDDGSDS